MNKKHGLYKTSTYSTWHAMRQRCSNSSRPNYHLYGGRGISVCERWNSFESFLADMGEKPEGRQLDRINNDGIYEPGNCRWATPKENSNNRRAPSEIILGNTFGEWTPIKQLPVRGCSGVLMYLCKCSCGKECPVKKAALIDGSSSRCKNCSMIAPSASALSLVGRMYGSWTVLSVDPKRDIRGRIIFNCKCSCGIETNIAKTTLETGRSKGCRSCSAFRRPVKQCSICLCNGHRNIDIEESMCELLGFCRHCDKFDLDNFLLKRSPDAVSRARPVLL